MAAVSFTVPGEPMGKGRPKISTAGSFVRTYSPSKTVNYETLVKEMFAINNCPMLQGEIEVEVTAYLTIPQSKSKKIQEQMRSGNILPTKKPDCDNILKIVCDALNGLAYHDDSQIVTAKVRKVYAESSPRTEVLMTQIRGD